MQSERVDRCGFACSGHSCDADAARAAGVGETLFYHFLGYGMMLRHQALNESDCSRKHRDIASEYSFHHFRGRRERFASATLHIRVDRRGRRNSRIDCQAIVAWVVFWMLHGGKKMDG